MFFETNGLTLALGAGIGRLFGLPKGFSVLSASAPTRSAAMPAWRTAMRASDIAWPSSGARSASTWVVVSTFSRMSEMAFWFLSLSSSVMPSRRTLVGMSTRSHEN